MTRAAGNHRIWTLAWTIVVCVVICHAQERSSSTRPKLVVQTGHSWEILSLAFSPDGKILASGSRDQTVKLWDVATGAELRTFQGKSDIFAIAFSPDGKILAIDDGGTVTLWDVSKGVELRTIEANSVNTIAFHPDGKIIAAGTASGAVELCDVLTGRSLLTLKEDSGVFSLAFGQEGKILGSGSYNGVVKLWDVSTGAILQTFKGQFQINSIVFGDSGDVLVSDHASGDTMIRIWRLANGADLRTFKIDTDVKSVAFSPDGKTVAGGTDRRGVRLWDLSTKNELRTLKQDPVAYSQSVVFSPNGQILATGSPTGVIDLWQPVTGTHLRVLRKSSRWVQSVVFSPDGNTLVNGNSDGTVKLWHLVNDSEPRTLKTDFVESVDFSPDGKVLATGSFRGDAKLWDVATSTELRTLKGNSTSDGPVTFSPDGKVLASGKFRGSPRLWDVATGVELRTLVGDSDYFSGPAVFSPDGKLLATGTLDDTVEVWDVSTGKELFILKGHSGDVSSCVFSPVGTILASGSWDHTIKLWDVATGVELRTLKGHSFGGVLSLSFSSDGKILASGGQDDAIMLWEVATGTGLRALKGHSADVNSVRFSRNNKFLVSGSRDSTLKIWDVDSGSELATLVAIEQNDWLVVTPDGLFDGSPAAWNKILWRFNNNTFNHVPVEAFFSEFFHPGLLSEIFAGEHPVAPSDISQKDLRQPRLKLELADTKPDSTPKSREVTLKIAIADAPAGARDLRLFRNGSLVKFWHGEVLEGRNSATLEATIPIVAGENRLTAYVFNHDNIKSSDATLLINGADSLKRKGVAYILAVGINTYANPGYDLKNAVTDAQDFAKEFKVQQTKLNNYARVEIILLTDREATKAKILNALRYVSAKVQPEDALVIYFAGHGAAYGDRFYLIPHDLGYKGGRESINPAGLKSVLAHSISDRGLESALESIDAEQVVLVIDACNAGQALEAEERRRGPMNSKGLAQLAYEKGMYVLTAAQSYQAAQEFDRLGHGYLTFALVEEGLKTNAADRAPKDGQVLIREWLDYATQRVPQMQQDNVGKTRNMQRPRVFYRRETEPRPLIVAKDTAQKSTSGPKN